MATKKSKSACPICNPAEGHEGEYCERHQVEIHALDLRYESLFRFQRECRGKDHESYSIFMQSEYDPCGRILLQETDPDNLSITVLLANDVKLDTVIPEFEALGLRRTWAEFLHLKISMDLVHSWYGNARACIEVIPADFTAHIHWDVEPHDSMDDDENTPPDPRGGRHSVH